MPTASRGVLSAALDLDYKNSNIRFHRPGGASSYLFLNNAGASGVVLIEADGKRRSHAILSPDGRRAIDRGDPVSSEP